MPICSTPPVTVADASEALRIAQEQLTKAEGAHQVRQGRFTASLQSLGNACRQVTAAAYSAAGSRALLEDSAAIESEIESALRYPAGAPLRMKQGRVISLQSSSWTKRLFGIGNASRALQVEALRERHRMSATATTDRRTILASLRAEHTRVQRQLVEPCVDAHAIPLQAALASAHQLADEGTWGHAHAQQCVDADLERLKRTPLPDVMSVCTQMETELTTAFDWVEKRRWEKPVREVVSANRQLDKARNALASEPRRKARAAAFEAAGQSVPRHDVAALRERQKALADLKGSDNAFGTLYCTTVGNQAIHKMYDGARDRVSGSAVTAELERVHGDRLFARGARSRGELLEALADKMTPALVKDIFSVSVLQQRALYAAAKANARVSWRTARVPVQTATELVNACNARTLLRPDGLLYTGAEDGVAIDQAWAAPGSRKGTDLRFKVTGFSGVPIGSDHPYLGEKPGRVYTPDSCFAVAGLEVSGGGAVTVVLDERIVSADQLVEAVSLRL